MQVSQRRARLTFILPSLMACTILCTFMASHLLGTKRRFGSGAADPNVSCYRWMEEVDQCAVGRCDVGVVGMSDGRPSSFGW